MHLMTRSGKLDKGQIATQARRGGGGDGIDSQGFVGYLGDGAMRLSGWIWVKVVGGSPLEIPADHI